MTCGDSRRGRQAVRRSGLRVGCAVSLRVCTRITVLLLGLAPAALVEAQEPSDRRAGEGNASWEVIQSIGQPSRWRGLLGLAYGVDGDVIGGGTGVGASLAVFRDLFPPHFGAGALGLEGYLGHRADDLDGGARLLYQAQTVFAHAGVDWSAGHGRADAIFGVRFPIRRGGWPFPGAKVRIDWIPSRDHTFAIGGTAPLGVPLAGQTRPRKVDVELPRPPRRTIREAPPAATLPAIQQMRESARWLIALHHFFWLSRPQSITHRDAVAESRRAMSEMRTQLATRHAAAGQSAYDREREAYHGALDRAFGIALGSTEADARAAGRRHAGEARRIVLEEVILPYNRAFGQFKQPDVLGGLAARARARFVAWVQLQAPAQRGRADGVIAVMDEWLRTLEQLRGQIAGLATDSRVHWLPLALALRPEEHRTQEQIDALVALAFGRGFERGNAILFVSAPQFQVELERSIHETHTYHVLWPFDYPGFNPAGDTDGTAFRQTTEGYLRALINAVRRYDESGRLPVYMIVLDQHMYELRDARRWMNLLERPLSHRMRLPPRDSLRARSIAALQDTLRAAVTASARMQAERASLGDDWIRERVKVHVNITNPSDFSYRSRRVLPLPVGGDNLMRDHRKIVIRDVSNGDPLAGEVIVAGTAVGDHYTSPTWDDRALLLQGPASLRALHVVRNILERHGLRGHRLPEPLRDVPPPADLAARIEAAEAAGASARVMQVHNRTGFGDKEATFAQMLLYDLAPAGTVIYVPDSLWTSDHWMAQLLSAALRGCHVIVVAPALENAPSDGFLVMSRAHELLTRLVLAREALGEVIDAAGGDLRVGLFARESPLDDVPGLLGELLATYDDTPFLREIFPIAGAGRDSLDRARESPAPEPPLALPEPRERRPQLHRKTHLIASHDLLARLAVDSLVVALTTRALMRPAEAIVHATERGPLAGQQRVEVASALPARMQALARQGELEDPVLYFITGSMNKNVRSMALDGEVMVVVAGPWALQAYLDFAVLSGGVIWLENLEELDARFPPYTRIQRILGRWLHYVL